MIDENLLLGRDLHKPTSCEKCGGRVEYKGIGEYKCEDCKAVMYDDYGKVRNYLEENRGATQGEVAAATGVSTNTIRQLLRDDRLEVAENSAVFLHCEICGSPIRSGRYCVACEKKKILADSSSSTGQKKLIQGFGKSPHGDTGSMRFTR